MSNRLDHRRPGWRRPVPVLLLLVLAAVVAAGCEGSVEGGGGGAGRAPAGLTTSRAERAIRSSQSA